MSWTRFRTLSVKASLNNAGTLAAIVLYVVLCGTQISTFNIWIDEAYTLHTVSGSFSSTFHDALNFEQQPPLYYLLLHVWRFASPADIWARAFSTMAMVLALIVVDRFARKRLAVPSSLVTTTMAVNGLAVWAGGEARVYALAILLSALVVWFYFEAFIDDGSVSMLCAYIAVGVAALYTQYYLGVIMASGFLALLVARRSRAVVRFLAASAVIFVAALPIAQIVRHQLKATHVVSYKIPVTRGVHDIAAIIMDDVYPHGWLHLTGLSALFDAAFTLLAILALVVLVLSVRRRLDTTTVVLMTLVAAGAPMFLFANQVLHEQIAPRYLVALFVPVLLAPFSLIGLLDAGLRTRVEIAYCVSAAVLGAIAVTQENVLGAKAGDWKRVTAYVERQIAPGEPILFFPAEEEVVFNHYDRTLGPRIPIPTGPRFDRYDPSDEALHSSAEVALALSNTHAAPTVILVQSYPCRFEYWDLGCAHLETYIARHYKTLSERTFFGTRVLELSPLAQRE